MLSPQLTTVDIGRDLVSMSIVDKQNESGLGYNERLLILVHTEWFGYISKFNKQDPPASIDLATAKVKVQIQYLYKVQRKENILEIKFTMLVDQKYEPRIWFIKFISHKMASLWQRLFELEIANRVKTSSNNRDRKSVSKPPDRIERSPSKILIQSQYQITAVQNKPKPEVIKEVPIKTDQISRPKVLSHSQSPSLNSRNNPTQLDDGPIEFINPMFEQSESQQSQNLKKQSSVFNAPPVEMPKMTLEIKRTGSVEFIGDPKAGTPSIRVHEAVLLQSDILSQQLSPQLIESNTELLNLKAEQSASIILSGQKLLDQRSPKSQDSQFDEKEAITRKQQKQYEHKQSSLAPSPQIMVSKIEINLESVKRDKNRPKHDRAAIISPPKHKRYDLHELKCSQTPNNADQQFDYKLINEVKVSQSNKRDTLKSINSSRHHHSQVLLHTSANQLLSADAMNEVSKWLAALRLKTSRIPLDKILYEENDPQRIKRTYNIKQIHSKPSKHVEMIHDYIVQAEQKRLQKLLSEKEAKQVDWTYKMLTRDEIPILDQWKEQCRILMVQICEEILMNCPNRKYKPIKQENGLLHFQVKEIDIRILTGRGKASKVNTALWQLDQLTIAKQMRNQFKNYSHLYKVIANRGLIRVPLLSLCEYCGLIALFKSKSQCYAKITTPTKQLMKDVQRINSLSSIDSFLLTPLSKSQLYTLNEYHYEGFKINSQPKVSFDLIMVEHLDRFLIHDFAQQKETVIQSVQSQLLRPELIYMQINEKIIKCVKFNQQALFTVAEVAEMEGLSNKITNKIDHVVWLLSTYTFVYICPSELSDLMHSNGINIRYLGQIWNRLQQYRAKDSVMADIAARICKHLFCEAMRDHCSDSSKSSNTLKSIVIDFFNCVFGKSLQSDAIWELLSGMSLKYFNVKLENRSSLDKHQFVLNVAYHCKLEINWNAAKPVMVLQTDEFFNENTLISVQTKTKIYTPVSKAQYTDIYSKLSSRHTDDFNLVVNKLNLKEKSWPQIFHVTESTLETKRFMARFLAPPSNVRQYEFKHLNIYQNHEICRVRFDIDLIKIKWYLRLKKRDMYLSHFDAFVKKVDLLFGECHPLLSQLYDIFSKHHLSQKQYQDSITFAKSSLKNLARWGGDNSMLLAAQYYKLAICQSKAQNNAEAIEALRKANQIIQSYSKKNLVLYAKVKLQLSILLEINQQYKQTLEECKIAIQIFEVFEREQQQSFQAERTQIYSIMLNCCNRLNLTNDKKQLAVRCSKKLDCFDDCSNFKTVLRLYIQQMIGQLRQDLKLKYKFFLLDLPYNSSIVAFKKSFNFLRRRAKESTLPSNFQHYCQNIDKIMERVEDSKALQTWKPLSGIFNRETVADFIALSEEIAYFIGVECFLKAFEQ